MGASNMENGMNILDDNKQQLKNVFTQFIDHAVKRLESDSRFIGLAIAGSWVRNEIDEYSDLDLVIVYKSDSAPEPREMQSIAEKLGELVSSFTGEHVGESSLLICLYRNPLRHVDLKFSTLSELRQLPYDPVIAWECGSVISDFMAEGQATPLIPDAQWIEDRFWTWVHYGALRMGRGEVFDLIGFLCFLRERVLGPLALHNAGFSPFGVRKIEQCIPEFAVHLEKTVPNYDLKSCYSALLVTVDIYKELRGNIQGNVVPNTSAETESLRYLDQIASKILS